MCIICVICFLCVCVCLRACMCEGCVSEDSIEQYVDASQLTSDLGGTLCYDHMTWVSNRVVSCACTYAALRLLYNMTLAYVCHVKLLLDFRTSKTVWFSAKSLDQT